MRFSNFNWMVFVRRGAIITTFIVCYALTSFISGYVSGGLYSRNGGMVLHNFLLILMFVCAIQFLCNICSHVVPSCSSLFKKSLQFKLSCMESSPHNLWLIEWFLNSWQAKTGLKRWFLQHPSFRSCVFQLASH